MSPAAPHPDAPPPLRVIDLGRLAYAPALAEQRRVNQAVIDGDEPATLLLVEHDPVITVSHRPTAAGNVTAPPARLAALGIDVQETDRGGDVTYHGPGQLVAYPILRLADYGLNLGRYMRFLEDVVIGTVAAFGVAGERDACATGVWVQSPESKVQCPESKVQSRESKVQSPELGPRNPASVGSCDSGRGPLDPGLAKLCAMGVRVRKNVTMHGLALNVTTDLSHFATIVPCGLAGRPVTSLHALLGDACPTMDEVKRTLVERFQHAAAARSAAAIGARAPSC